MNTTEAVASVESTQVENEVKTITVLAQNWPTVIQSNEQATDVAQARQIIQTRIKNIENLLRPNIKKADDLHKGLVAQLKQALVRPLQMQAQANDLLSAWTRAEQERVAAEQRRLDDEERKKQAAQAKADGDKVLAKKITEGKVAVASTQVAAPVAKVAGVAMVETWSAEVSDLLTLVKAVAAGKEPLSYLEANTVALNGAARATKGQIQIPGVRMVSKMAPRSTSR